MPVHEFMLRHKFAVDTAGIVIDVIGVVAGGVFICTAAPALLAAGTTMAAVDLITGSTAAVGSIMLFAADGIPYFARLAGHDAYAEHVENNATTQWIRIAGSLMLLPDIAVGTSRSLLEIGQLGREANEAIELRKASSLAASAARERVAAIRNPERHPGPVGRRAHRAAMLEAATLAHARAAEEATAKLLVAKYRDIFAFQGASVAGTGVLVASPPDIAMSEHQREVHENYRRSLAPKGGMPSDVRIEMRVTSHDRNLP